MLNAIAKMTTDAVGAVADTVENILPGKGGNDAADPADADTARDQDTVQPPSKDDKKTSSSKAVQGEGLASHQLDESPEANISRSSDNPKEPEPTEDMNAKEAAGPEFETTEKKTTSKGKEKVTTHKDDVKVKASAPQQKDLPKTGSAGKSSETSKAADSSSQQSLTAGGQPLPKMSRGKAKWMKSSTLWYPDRAGIMHAPGVYINRKPRSSFMNPMHKVEVSF